MAESKQSPEYQKPNRSSKIVDPTPIPDSVEVKIIASRDELGIGRKGKAADMNTEEAKQAAEYREFVKNLAAELKLNIVRSGKDQDGHWDKVQASSGPREPLRISMERNSRRAYLVSFTIEHPLVERISAEAAKEAHIGNARGELDLGKPGLKPVLEAAMRFLAGQAPAAK